MSRPWRSAASTSVTPPKRSATSQLRPASSTISRSVLGHLAAGEAGHALALLPVEPERGRRGSASGCARRARRGRRAGWSRRWVTVEPVGRAGPGEIGSEREMSPSSSSRAPSRKVPSSAGSGRSMPACRSRARCRRRAGDQDVQPLVEPQQVVGAAAGADGEVAVEPRAAVVGGGEAGEGLGLDAAPSRSAAPKVAGEGSSTVSTVPREGVAARAARCARASRSRSGRSADDRGEEPLGPRLLVGRAAGDRDAVDEALDHQDAHHAVGDGLLRQHRLRQHEAAGAVGRADAGGDVLERGERHRLADELGPDRRELVGGDRGRAFQHHAVAGRSSGPWRRSGRWAPAARAHPAASPGAPARWSAPGSRGR